MEDNARGKEFHGRLHQQPRPSRGKTSTQPFVFISHAGNGDFVANLKKMLQEQGIPLFQCRDCYPMANPWADYIRANARMCRLFIAVLSPLYFTRYWCMQELCLAMTQGQTIMPVSHHNMMQENLPSDKAQFIRAFENDERIQYGELDAWWACVTKLRDIKSVQASMPSRSASDGEGQLIRDVVEETKRVFGKVDPVSTQSMVQHAGNAQGTTEERILRDSRVNEIMHSPETLVGKYEPNGKLTEPLAVGPFHFEEEEEELPLHQVLWEDYATKEALCDVLEENPDALYLDDDEGRLAIHVACFHQASVEPVVKLANLWRSSLAFPAKNGTIPLHEACKNKHVAKGAIIEALVGMSPKSTQVQDNMGRCPVHVAASHGASLDVFRALIKSGNNNAQELFVVDKDGMLPLHLACLSGAPKECQSFLCEKMLEHCNAKKFEIMGSVADFLRGQGNDADAERIQAKLVG